MTEAAISLIVYNQGTALVRDRRTVELQAGLNTLDFTDVTAQIDATSVTFTAVGAPETIVLEQNYRFDLVGGEALLRRYLEQTIEITLDDGTRCVGKLLNTGSYARNTQDDLILQLADGQLVFARTDKIRDIRFPSLPGGLITRPTLRWLLHSVKAGAQPIEITYLTGGLKWSADYNLLLAVDNRHFDLNGWVTLTNTSGATFTEAQIKLVAGEVQRLRALDERRARLIGEPMVVGGSEPQVKQREIFEYQLYEINRPVTVAQNETKQVEFITAREVKAELFYIFRTPPLTEFYSDQPFFERDFALSGGTVQTWLEFSTGDEGDLGADLPAGRMRVYQNDTDGSAVLIGENAIKHTPKGEIVKLELGKAFDLVGERTRTRFYQPHKNAVEESYTIALRNRKDTQTVEIRVVEQLFRWHNWELIQHSHPYTVQDAAHIEFRAEVSPGAEVVVSYTVRYEWAE